MNSSNLSTPLHLTGELYFCSICNKPFKKEHTRNRHIPYCRRTHNGPRSRTRPCRECRDAKAKCSSRPRCLRCARKGLECVVEDYNSPRASETTPDQFLQPLLADGDGFLHDMDEGLFGFDPSDTQVLSRSGIGNSALVQSPGLRAFTSQRSPPDALTYLPRTRSIASSRTTNYDNDMAMSWPIWITPNDQFQSSLSLYTPTFPTSRPMALRKMSNQVAENSANYIIRALRSFPQRMLRRATFPPFIHRPWPTDSDGFVIDEHEPVANCMSIAQMFTSRTPQNSAFVWRTIRAEQQRLVDKMNECSKEEFLATIQANIIYLTMRIADDAGMLVEPDRQMVIYSQMMCNSFGEFCRRQALELTHASHKISWQDWIFAESRRRVGCIWFLITRVASAKASIICEDLAGFFDLPLPSSKLLWEASTSELWEFEYEIDALEKSARISTIGELIDAHQHPNTFSNTRLDSWNAGCDDLGFLLNLAVTMA